MRQERHALAAHAEDGGEDIDGGADAADAVDEQSDRPVVDGVPGREGPLGERRIGEPADIGRGARPRRGRGRR